jgi:uncharacterized membrane protein YraQ (UPF0718 family)
MSSVATSRALAAPARKILSVQIAVAVLMCATLAFYFWIDSRYPALLKKFHSGKAVHIAGALSFDALMPVSPQMPVATRIGHTTVNWMYANRVGMSFGIAFGAAILTLLPTLSRRRFRSPIANTVAGALTGIPLGVCANCVAPIGQSMYEAGAEPATVLATMISSPTLNVVVLAMLFALFPLPIAAVRVTVPVVFIVLVAWLTRRIKPAEVFCPAPSHTGVLSAATKTLKQYFINLGKLAATTVPLMILAGLLGAVVIEVVPQNTIPVNVTVLGIVLVALVGTFLPVPIAFDVAASFLLFSRGVPLPYVVTLLCTLGTFSVYGLLILGRTISWRTAFTVYSAVAFVGMLAGFGAALVS